VIKIKKTYLTTILILPGLLLISFLVFVLGSFAVTSDNPDAEKETTLTQHEVYQVTLLEYRTYGRVFLQVDDTSLNYHFILAEPRDVEIDGGSRFSLVTQNMEIGSTYEVRGIISQPCFDKIKDEIGDLQCIAWMDLESVNKLR
jgi:hypothetical protein